MPLDLTATKRVCREDFKNWKLGPWHRSRCSWNPCRLAQSWKPNAWSNLVSAVHRHALGLTCGSNNAISNALQAHL
jgi:hypothetical protein